MRKHTEENPTVQSPFSFWSGFWLGLDAVATIFQGPSRYQPPRYRKMGGLASDWNAVGGDMQSVVAQIKKSRK